MLLGPLLFLLLLPSVVVSFTRHARQVVMTDSLSWDPYLTSVDELCERVVSSSTTTSSSSSSSPEDLHSLCRDMTHSALSDSVDRRINAFYKAYTARYDKDFMSEYLWLDYTDGMTQTQTMETILEIRHLISGRIYPRSYCNHVAHINEVPRCVYYQYVKDLGIVGLTLSSSNLISNLESNLINFGILTEDLFNHEHYEHAEAMAVFLLKAVITPLLTTEHYERSKVIFEQTIIRASVVISEIEKLRGHMDHSSTFSLNIINSYQHLEEIDAEHEHFNPSQLYLYKLRCLLTIPSIPPDYEISMVLRQEMVDDLTRFLEIIESSGVDLPMTMLAETISATSFYMAHQGLDDKDVQILVAKIFRSISRELNFVANHLNSTVTSNVKKRLKIGFVSNHFLDHSIGRIMLEVMSLLKHMDTTLEKEIFVYSIGKTYVHSVESAEDAVVNEPLDYISSQMDSIFKSNFIRLPMNAKYVRDVIAKDELDVLIFADIGMDFTSYLLSFSRLATVQAAFWGHPVTSGQFTIDYYFSLDDEVLHADLFYTEQMVRMNYINSIPLPVDQYDLPKNTSVFETLELPQDAVVAVVLGRLFKMHPSFLRVMISLLAYFESMDEGARATHFVVFFAESVVDFNRIIVNQMTAMLQEALGGDTARVGRIMRHLKLLSYNHYFEISKLARVAMDTFPYGGCITAHDAFFSGVPLVTLPLEHIRGRYAASLYRQMDFQELIATSPEEYLTTILRLSSNEDYYKQTVDKLRQGFQYGMRKNVEVANEWIGFIQRLYGFTS